MSTDWIKDVAEFHRACDVPIKENPGFPDDERVDLRVDLIDEEAREFFVSVRRREFVDTADALADLIYVAIGTALEFGIPLDRVWDEVQRANMAKVDPSTGKVRRREDGKVLKPDGWRPPDIKAALEPPKTVQPAPEERAGRW